MEQQFHNRDLQNMGQVFLVTANFLMIPIAFIRDEPTPRRSHETTPNKRAGYGRGMADREDYRGREQIAEIKWTVYGKISDIVRSGGSAKPHLAFEYGPWHH